jgi:hypothetical protein
MHVFLVFLHDRPSSGIETVASNVLQWNMWQQVTVTWIKSNSTAQFYVNGMLAQSNLVLIDVHVLHIIIHVDLRPDHISRHQGNRYCRACELGYAHRFVSNVENHMLTLTLATPFLGSLPTRTLLGRAPWSEPATLRGIVLNAVC